MNVRTENTVHEEASLLLPWYVNGTLDGSQKTLVEDHVRSCIVCRRTLSFEHRIREVFHNENPLDQSVQAGFERLQRRITARTPLPSGKHRSTEPTWTRILDSLRSVTGGRHRSGLVAASLAAVAIGFALAHFSHFSQELIQGYGYGSTGAAATADGYRTLSNPVVGTANPDDVQVIFSPGTSIETIEGLLTALPATIIAGPNRAGAYTIRLLEVSGEGERRAAIHGLRNQRQVIFAEAAQPEPVSYQGGVQSQ